MRGLVALTLLAAGCALEVTPYDACVEADDGGCCANSDCPEDSVCDFRYTCRDRLDGGLDCTEPEGDRTCKSVCDTEGGCMWGDGECTLVEDFAQGTQDPRDMWICF